MKLHERANAGLHDHVEQTIRRVCANPGARILDVGAGTGAFLSRLKRAGHADLHGIDIALPAEKIEGVQFHALDLDTGVLPFADGAIDTISCIEVIEHIENPGAFLKELARVLAKEGALVMTTPNVHAMEARLRFLLLGRLKQFDDLSDPTHMYPVFLFPFKRLLARHGLTVAEAWGYPTDGSSPTSRPGLRWLAQALKVVGLRSEVSGDHLCMVIRHTPTSTPAGISKREAVAGHY